MKKCLLYILLIFFPTLIAHSQQSSVCNSENHNDLDFWVGSWNLTWNGGYGTNKITKEYGDCVIRESFTGTNMIGMSVSTFNVAENRWRQIWMDEQNDFIDLYGFEKNNTYTFQTLPIDGSKMASRMVFSDIEKNSFLWTWQRSEDNGVIWNDLWQIKYTRIR